MVIARHTPGSSAPACASPPRLAQRVRDWLHAGRALGAGTWAALSNRLSPSAGGRQRTGHDAATAEVPPCTAFFYGSHPPIDALARFPRVVVEADACDDLPGLRRQGALVFAYVSLGEAEGWRASARALPDGIFAAKNPLWSSRVADLTHPAWCHYLLDDRLAKLWNQGYRGFFLDTLDSYRLAFHKPEDLQRQQNALVQLIQNIHARYPDARLLINRGFELLPRIHPCVDGLVAESLFQTWDASTQRYGATDEKGQAWLLGQLRRAREVYGLPVTVIDYVDPSDSPLILKTQGRIEAQGCAAWIAGPGLNALYTRTNA